MSSAKSEDRQTLPKSGQSENNKPLTLFVTSPGVRKMRLVTITYAGSMQIPMSLRADTGRLDRNIDSEMGRLIQPPPAGFLRKHSRQISADRANATFNLVDRQIEVPFPNDVVSIDMRHRIRQDKPNSTVWNCSITGTVRLSPTAAKNLAWRRFFSIAAQRMNFIRNATVNPAATPNVLQPALDFLGITVRRPGVFVQTVEMEEDLFKNESRFAINFRIIGAKFIDIAAVSGLWQPIVNNATSLPPEGDIITADLWHASLANNAQQFKGGVGVGFGNANEIILDVCGGPNPYGGVGGVFGIRQRPQTTPDDTVPVSDLDDVAKDGEFDKESTWIDWQCTPEMITDYHQIRHKPLGGTVTMTPPTVDPFGNVAPVAANVDPSSVGSWKWSSIDRTQQVAAPSVTLRLRGFGIRVGYRVFPPRLISFGGRPQSSNANRPTVSPPMRWRSAPLGICCISSCRTRRRAHHRSSQIPCWASMGGRRSNWHFTKTVSIHSL
jgi:hypothetical protein